MFEGIAGELIVVQRCWESLWEKLDVSREGKKLANFREKGKENRTEEMLLEMF